MSSYMQSPFWGNAKIPSASLLTDDPGVHADARVCPSEDECSNSLSGQLQRCPKAPHLDKFAHDILETVAIAKQVTELAR
jgi:hypothetical protein